MPFYVGAAAGARVALDLGCGTGRLLPHLAAPGRRVIGVDASAPMLAAAAARAAGAALLLADLRAWAPPPFDAAVMACNTLNLLDAAEREALWARLAGAARPGARLAADLYVWTPAIAALPPLHPWTPRVTRGRATRVERVWVDAAARAVHTEARRCPGGARYTALTQHLPAARELLDEAHRGGWRCDGLLAAPERGATADPRDSPRVWGVWTKDG